MMKVNQELVLGTKSADLVEIDNKKQAKEYLVRLNAMIERDRLENQGYGDQLMEVQEFLWPVERIRNGTFKKLDMCFSYEHDGEKMLQWCQGEITEVVKDKERNNYMVVKVTWNKDSVNPGESEITTEKLEKGCWNPEVHEKGAWREDLRELVKTSDDVINE